MKVELTASEMGWIIGLMQEYKKTHPFNKDEIKICDELFLKFIDAVHPRKK